MALTLIFLSFFYQGILKEAGDFLAPTAMAKADVVILEGSELVRENGVRIGMSLLSSGRASRMVVVYQHSEEEKVFTRPLNYNDFLSQKLENLGLRKDQILVLSVPKEHPITLTEAQIVLSNLTKNGVRSAILLAESFHTRRSFWTYKQVGLPLGIKIVPHPYFIKFRKENWWQHNQGVREFSSESLKFLYYLLRGYIPLKSLVVI